MPSIFNFGNSPDHTSVSCLLNTFLARTPEGFLEFRAAAAIDPSGLELEGLCSSCTGQEPEVLCAADGSTRMTISSIFSAGGAKPMRPSHQC